MKLLPELHANLVKKAIESAQAAGDLPQFEIPDIPITPAKREGQGDYACPVAMALAKVAAKKPRDIAEMIVKHLPKADFVSHVEFAGPGFINFTLSQKWLKQQIEAIIAEGEDYFSLDIGAGHKAQVEFVSANPSGPITIGRSRGGIIGDTMARLLEAAGFDVQREYYFNNAGMQMVMLGKSLKARYLQALGQDEPLPEGGYQGEYLIDFANELADEQGDALVDADWKPFKEFAEAKMFEWIRDSLAQIGITHDNFFNEDSMFQDGSIWAVLEELDERGYAYKATEWAGASDEEKAKAADREPAVWFRTTAFGDEKDRVMVKSDGIPTYTLPDIAYHKNKIERGFDIMVNVLGADHGQQYKVVQMGIEALGMDPSGIHVIINQMVKAVRQNPETGELEEIKMSTRRGVYDTLDELVEMTSPDAIRYHMLARSPSSHLNFNVEEVVKQSNDNPVYYIQNAHVRCCGIAREAEARGLSDEGADISLLSDEELAFIRKALEMGEIIETAVNQYEPHKIAFYAQELASTFHPIYDNVRALGEGIPEDVTRARLRFYHAARIIFKRVLDLMGMSAPERM
ncbi:MAG: arginine--tRNA ligase [Anaerolineae bacterium]|nr:arginine--tRNA ligase [Anaerolineae bacterium]